MEYDIQFICFSCKITEIERKRIVRKHRKKHMYDSKEPVVQKRFLEVIKRKYSIQLWMLQGRKRYFPNVVIN